MHVNWQDMPIAEKPGPETATTLDITALTCPMTFVRVRLLLERLPPGAEACVRLAGAEPHANIPRQLARLGHAILSFVPEEAAATGVESPWLLSFRKRPA